MSITAELKKSRIIAAVKDEDSFNAALSSKAGVVFLLKSDLLSAEETVRRAHESGKKILLHVDLMEGIGKDEAAIKFIAEKIRPDGIITTRPNIVKCARAKGLYTVFRVFLIDTQGLNSAIINADKLFARRRGAYARIGARSCGKIRKRRSRRDYRRIDLHKRAG